MSSPVPPTSSPTGSADPGEAHPIVPTSADLFLGFLSLGMISFGGALPLARNMVVERKRWLSSEEFSDLLGLCQFLPGGNILNLSVALGMKFRGPWGGFCALMGMIAMPSVVVIALGVFYDAFRDNPHIRHMFAGLAAAASGLLISMSLKIAKPLRHAPVSAVIALLGFIAIAVFRLPLLPTMLVLVVVSLVVVGRRA